VCVFVCVCLSVLSMLLHLTCVLNTRIAVLESTVDTQSSFNHVRLLNHKASCNRADRLSRNVAGSVMELGSREMLAMDFLG
jgi:hypothetical protein